MFLETGGGPAARPLASAREEVQVGGGVEPGVDRTAMRRLREPDKAAPAQIRRGVVQPASVRAKLGREVLAGEQTRPRVRLDELHTARARKYSSAIGREASPGWGTSRLKTNTAQRGRRIVEE